MYIIFQFEKILKKSNEENLLIPKAFTEMVRLLQSKGHKVIILSQQTSAETLKRVFTLEPKPNEMLTEKELDSTIRVIFDSSYKMHHVQTYGLTQSDNMIDKLQAYLCFIHNKKINQNEIFIVAYQQNLFSTDEKIACLEKALEKIEPEMFKQFCADKYRFNLEYQTALMTTSNNYSHTKIPDDNEVTERTGLLSSTHKYG